MGVGRMLFAHVPLDEDLGDLHVGIAWRAEHGDELPFGVLARHLWIARDAHCCCPPVAWLAPRALLNAAGPWREDLSLNDDGEYFCRVLLRSAGNRYALKIFCDVHIRSAIFGYRSHQRDLPHLASVWLEHARVARAVRRRDAAAAPDRRSCPG